MVKASVVGVVAMVLGAGSVAWGADPSGWEAKQGPLMTRWAKEVSPDKVLPEYPRPQMVRERWLNLNGVWECAEGKEGTKPPVGTELAEKILVPFPVESALSGVMKHWDRVWYRRTFTVPSEWAGQRVLLHFGAVDWGCSLYVNGKHVGIHRGGYDPFSFDITKQLKKEGGENEIFLSVWDPTDQGDQPRGKQVLQPRGIWYTPTSGIWQTVWAEPVPRTRVESLRVVPDVDAKVVRVSATLSGPEAESAHLQMRVKSQGKTIAVAEPVQGREVIVPIESPHLWSPGDPFLYDLEVSAGEDTITSYFGMRKIALGKDDKGVTRILLNNKPLFEVGMLDQGFWPDGLYTAPTDEALKFDIEQQKRWGFNLIRKHVKVEPERWYYWCDKLGMLVWQDMPSVGSKEEPEKAAKSKEQFESELTHLIQTHGNHPSIVMWVVFNEGWGEYDVPRVVEIAKKLDASRLVDDASGWTDKGVGDVIDMHLYPGPGAPKGEGGRAAVLGEFGGLGLNVEGHRWAARQFSYSGMESPDDLVAEFTRLLSRAWDLNERAGLSACIYTQTTDVEGEINGLMTYDRTPKADEARIRTAVTGHGPHVEVKPVVPSAMEEGGVWKYVTEKPADGWQRPGFDDARWKNGEGGFGTKDANGGKVRTPWEGGDVWLRREVELPADVDAKGLKLWMNYDDSCEVWINGAEARRRRHAASQYEEQPISKEAAATIKPGKNLIAVHAHNDGGPGYVDVGLVRLVETPR